MTQFKWRNDINKNAQGGTELLMERLISEFGDSLEPFQIIPSRVRELDSNKIRILYLHDLAGDPENKHLQNEGWKNFHKLVFVSYHQREEYLLRFGIPPSRTTVLHNSIEPISVQLEDKKLKNNDDVMHFIYHTTPHRGLGLLVPVFSKLCEKYENIHLHVYSSFSIYGWPQRDEPFEPLFEQIKNHPNMTYYGSVENSQIRDVLKQMHVFAYPSIWMETSCLSLMEAMSAGLMCVHSSLGALPETSANWTMMYDFDEDHNRHANKFYAALDHAISILRTKYPISELNSQKSYTDLFYSWNLRKLQWQDLLHQLQSEIHDTKLPSEEFSYKAI